MLLLHSWGGKKKISVCKIDISNNHVHLITGQAKVVSSVRSCICFLRENTPKDKLAVHLDF